MGGIWSTNTRPVVSDDAMLVDEPGLPLLAHIDDLPTHSNNGYSHLAFSNDLLDDGSRWKTDGHREKQCMTCGDWIDLGKVDTGEIALINHEGKRRCLAKVERRNQMQESIEAAEALEDLRRSVTFSPCTRRHSRRVTPLNYFPLTPLSNFSGSASST